MRPVLRVIRGIVAGGYPILLYFLTLGILAALEIALFAASQH